MAGIEKLVTNGIQAASCAIQKSDGVIQNATKPVEACTEKLTSSLNQISAFICVGLILTLVYIKQH